MHRPGIVLVIALWLGASPRASAQLPDLWSIGQVILAERVPPQWLRDDADRLPLEPARQRRRMPARCRTRGGYRQFCQGARRVPTPFGEAAELAEHLGLGQRASAMHVLHQRPFGEWLAAVAHLGQERRLTFPVPVGRMGRGFGYTRDAGLREARHDGIDIGAAEGSPILAARDGLVIYSDDGITGMGNVLILLHQDGASTLYAHCLETLVFAGQYVARGQPVARIGETGFANAPHLHFEWRLRGWLRDPSRHFLPRPRA